jgi:hypothetical protein
MQDITDTLHALVLAMSEVHSGNQAEAYAIARAVFVAIRDGKVPLMQMEAT